MSLPGGLSTCPLSPTIISPPSSSSDPTCYLFQFFFVFLLAHNVSYRKDSLFLDLSVITSSCFPWQGITTQLTFCHPVTVAAPPNLNGQTTAQHWKRTQLYIAFCGTKLVQVSPKVESWRTPVCWSGKYHLPPSFSKKFHDVTYSCQAWAHLPSHIISMLPPQSRGLDLIPL